MQAGREIDSPRGAQVVPPVGERLTVALHHGQWGAQFVRDRRDKVLHAALERPRRLDRTGVGLEPQRPVQRPTGLLREDASGESLPQREVGRQCRAVDPRPATKCSTPRSRSTRRIELVPKPAVASPFDDRLENVIGRE